MALLKHSIIASAVTVFLIIGCSTTQRRVLKRWDASVKDYLYFPSRQIKCGGSPKAFIRKPDIKYEELLKNEFESDDLSKFIKKTKTQALLIIKDDSLVLEKYGMGYDSSSTVTSFSVAKSFDSAIIGTLIDSGKITSVDEPITSFIPELLERDSRFAKITVRHLMMMSSGILYEEKLPRKDDTQTYFNPDLRSLAINKTLIKEDPGLHFLYNNYNPLFLNEIY